MTRIPGLLMAASALLGAAIAQPATPSLPPAGDFAVHMVVARARVYAEACSAKNPRLKEDFDRAIAELGARVDAVAKPLLASGKYKALASLPLPAEVTEVVATSIDALREQISDAGASTDCSAYLAKIATLKGEALQSSITQALDAMQEALVNHGPLQ